MKICQMILKVLTLEAARLKDVELITSWSIYSARP